MSYNEFVLLFNLNVYNFSVYILRLDQRPQVDSNASKKLTTPVRFIPCPFPLKKKKKKVAHPWAGSCQGLLMSQWMEYFHVNDCNICALIYIIQNRFHFQLEIIFSSCSCFNTCIWCILSSFNVTWRRLCEEIQLSSFERSDYKRRALDEVDIFPPALLSKVW